MSAPSTRFAHIDSLRAIAALLVVWAHTSELFVLFSAPSIQNQLYHVAYLMDFGRVGVVIFFAISGFVIPTSLRGNRLECCREFLIKRLLRLYPIYWLSIPFGLITLWYIWGKEISLSTILWNLTMMQEAAGHPAVQGQYWTLQAELVFYGLCVLVFLQGVLRSAVTLSLLIFGMSALFFVPMALEFVGRPLSVAIHPAVTLLALNLGVMFWGALFRIWYDRTPMPVLAKLSLFGYVGCWLVMATVGVAYYLLVKTDIKILRFPIPYALGVAMFAGLVIYGKFKSALLVWLGTISYSLYLFHPVVMYSLSWLIQHSEIDWLKGWPIAGYMLVTLAATIAISALTYRVVELPAIRLGNMLTRNWRYGRGAEKVGKL
jgi:peptidoglycan/LPS O-acetylase OafA/YrhL